MRDSKEGYRVVRILRNAKRPLTAREVCERMGKNPTDSKDYNAVRRLLQRHAMAGNIARDGHGHYMAAIEVKKPKTQFEVAWGGTSRQDGAMVLDFGIRPRSAHLPTLEEVLGMTNTSLPQGDQVWENLIQKEMNKQAMNGHKPNRKSNK